MKLSVKRSECRGHFLWQIFRNDDLVAEIDHRRRVAVEFGGYRRGTLGIGAGMTYAPENEFIEVTRRISRILKSMPPLPGEEDLEGCVCGQVHAQL